MKKESLEQQKVNIENSYAGVSQQKVNLENQLRDVESQLQQLVGQHALIVELINNWQEPKEEKKTGGK